MCWIKLAFSIENLLHSQLGCVDLSYFPIIPNLSKKEKKKKSGQCLPRLCERLIGIYNYGQVQKKDGHRHDCERLWEETNCRR
jgi:hypothetical protein